MLAAVFCRPAARILVKINVSRLVVGQSLFVMRLDSKGATAGLSSSDCLFASTLHWEPITRLPAARAWQKKHTANKLAVAPSAVKT